MVGMASHQESPSSPTCGLTIPVPNKRSLDSCCREELLAMRAEDRWNSQTRSCIPYSIGNQTDNRRPWRSLIEGETLIDSAPPTGDLGTQATLSNNNALSSNGASPARSLSMERIYERPRNTRRYSVDDSHSSRHQHAFDTEALGLRPGWAREALAAGNTTKTTVTANNEGGNKILKREHSFYCTSRGMIPGVLSFTQTVLTFEPTSGAEFQCIISIADIWEVASIVVPKTAAVERMFNLPPSSDVLVPSWVKQKPPPAGENPNPSLALVQILLKQKRGRLPQKSHSVYNGGRRDSAHKLGEFRRVGSKDTTPASTTYMEDIYSINRPAITQNTSPAPKHFILFRVPTCTSAREITRTLLNQIRQINDNARHFTYVPYYSPPELDQEPKDPGSEVYKSSLMSSLVREDLFKHADGNIDGGLTAFMMTELSWRMPPTIALRKWQLLFDTRIHGVSMQTLFSKIKDHSPALIYILDSNNYVFGGYSPVGFMEARHYYGSGETFVYTFGNSHQPKLETYHWTGTNNLFIYSNHDRIIFGGGSGGVANRSTSTWAFAIDGNLLSGTSANSPTFDNGPLTSTEDWLIQRVQVRSIMDIYA